MRPFRLHVLITIVSVLPSLALALALALALTPTLTLVANFFWIAIPRQIDPGAALRLRVVPLVIFVIIVVTTVVIVWVR
jgi:hypothetical protein